MLLRRISLLASRGSHLHLKQLNLLAHGLASICKAIRVQKTTRTQRKYNANPNTEVLQMLASGQT